MFEIVRLVSDLWVAVIMAGLIWFWLCDVDSSRWQEWVLSACALPPVVLTLWRALADIGAVAVRYLDMSIWLR